MDAISKMPRPKDISKVRAFTGINYYGRFIRNPSSILHPLTKLLRKGSPSSGQKIEKSAFQQTKTAFTSKQVLVYFNSKLPLVLATDASPYGVGAVLSHQYLDGSEKIIQFASTLSDTQNIDKETFAIIFGVKINSFNFYMEINLC